MPLRVSHIAPGTDARFDRARQTSSATRSRWDHGRLRHQGRTACSGAFASSANRPRAIVTTHRPLPDFLFLASLVTDIARTSAERLRRELGSIFFTCEFVFAHDTSPNPPFNPLNRCHKMRFFHNGYKQRPKFDTTGYFPHTVESPQSCRSRPNSHSSKKCGRSADLGCFSRFSGGTSD